MGTVLVLGMAGFHLLGRATAGYSQSVPIGPDSSLVSERRASQQIEVMDVQATDRMVSGRVVNRSELVALRDVRLVIRNVWLWNDERNPGNDNPGRTGFHTITEDIPPAGSVTFVYLLEPPLPDRADGRFTTIVDVLSYVEVGP